jgi:beta-glucanase (GH16 family)
MRTASQLCVLTLLSAAGFTACDRNISDGSAVTDRRAEAMEWKLVWADEFDVDGPPSAANWDHEIGFVRNEELQWYQRDNATCENGLLILTARRERVDVPQHQVATPDWAKNRNHAEYTSASLTTKGLHQWQYGRFEMRARIDTRSGLWPAFWTLGTRGDWPHSGEIDIMEYYCETLLANALWGSKEKWVPISSIHSFPLGQFNDPEWSAQFHEWRMDWDKQRIEIFVDNKRLCLIDLDQTYNQDENRENPLKQPHYLLLSLAVGGTHGGDPSSTDFPAKFEIDYIRVYRRHSD